jgi:hypothetical protein
MRYGFKRTHSQVCSIAYPILEAVDELPAREPYGGGCFGMNAQAKHSSAKGHDRHLGDAVATPAIDPISEVEAVSKIGAMCHLRQTAVQQNASNVLAEDTSCLPTAEAVICVSRRGLR